MKSLNDKKAAAAGWFMIVIGVMGVVALIIYLAGYHGWFGGLSKSAEGAIHGLGDCDGDGTPNFNDRCPCLSYGTKESLAFKGCPAGTAEGKAKSNKKTCGWYISTEASCGEKDSKTCYEEEGKVYLSNCKGDNKDKCQKVKGNYQTRCAYLEGLVTPWSAEEKKGENNCNNCDLKITSFTLSKGGKNILNGKKSYIEKSNIPELELEVKLAIKNLGTSSNDNIAGSIPLGAYICKNNNNKNCQPATVTKGKGEEASSIVDLNYNDNPKEATFKIKVGTNGDYCDGEKKTECWLRLMVDSTNKWYEKAGAGEDNNEEYISITFENKKMKKYTFDKHKAVEIVCDDDWGKPNPESKAIHQTCPGYIGDTDEGYKCNSFETSCDKDEFPDSGPSKGCLVVSSEDDGTRNGCSWSAVQEGAIISNMGHAKIGPLALPITNTRSSDAERCFTWLYKAKDGTGSLLCKDQYWFECNSKATKGFVQLKDGRKFACQANGLWLPR